MAALCTTLVLVLRDAVFEQHAARAPAPAPRASRFRFFDRARPAQASPLAVSRVHLTNVACGEARVCGVRSPWTAA